MHALTHPAIPPASKPLVAGRLQRVHMKQSPSKAVTPGGTLKGRRKEKKTTDPWLEVSQDDASQSPLLILLQHIYCRLLCSGLTWISLFSSALPALSCGFLHYLGLVYHFAFDYPTFFLPLPAIGASTHTPLTASST